jgi:large subunit ribosomal protein L24
VQVKRSLRATGAHIRTQARLPVGRLHVKKGDIVLVLSGNDKGKTGEVKQALPRAGRVVVDGVNLRWRHKKPSQQNPKGERVQREAPIHASNVRLATAAPKASKTKATKATKSTATKKKS